MEFPIEYLREKNPLREMPPMQASSKALKWIIIVALLWTYNTKMLTPTIESITSMSRSYMVNGVQQNPAFYESITLSSAVILVSLFFFILARNEVSQVIKGDRSNLSDYSTTLAGIVISVLIIVLCSIDNPLLDFSPAKGMPFLIVGAPVLLAYYLVSNDLERIEDGKREPILYARIAAPLVLYILLAMNISMVPPVISSNLPAFFSATLILMALVMIIQISSETGNPLTHERRNSTMILIIGLPLILYMTTRLLYLLHNPDSVTRERWDLSWGFMDMKNTFEINAWPLQPDFPEDVRWEFLKGAILNSVRATLLAIVLCTFLGTIIGVTRLSSNKLASGLATIYVEIFRNMPLAVLLFLVTLQLGSSLPRFFEEASIAGWVYYSNQGIFIPKPETLRMILALGIIFSLWAWGKYRDREEVDDSSQALMKRSLVWSAALVVCLGLLLSGDMSLPNYVKPNLDLPGTWNIEEGSAFEITVEFVALIIGLTLFTAAVVAEIVRGSIQALPRGQVEAAISLGLSPYQRLRLVILPQALRSMIPLLNSQYMNVWKNSSLAIIVAYSDIFYVIFVMMNNVGKLIPLFLLLLVTYQAGSLLISGIMNFYNARVTKVKI